MDERIQCFFISPTGRVRRYLRRFRYTNDQSTHCCSAMVPHDVFDESDERRISRFAEEDEKRSLPWPTMCKECGDLFKEEDEWQFFCKHEYKRSDTGELTTISGAPPGAVWDAPWMIPFAEKPSPDGRYLVIKTPEGDWCVDGPSYSRGKKGPGWTRSGKADESGVTLTAKPSIGMGEPMRYHAWLRDGVLVKC